MSNISVLIDALKTQCPNIELRLNEPMKNHTSFKIGGAVSAMIFPASQEELIRVCSLTKEFGVKPFILGNGTNLLFDDKNLDMLVIKTHSGVSGVKLTGDTEITAESGVLLSRLAVFAAENGLSGLEFAHGIPGTLGGAVTMNAGAYGGEMADVVYSTKALSGGLREFETTGTEHDFKYRHSRFSDAGDIILGCSLRLFSGNSEEIRAKMEELSVKRRNSQPLNMPSGGSTFKRPENGYAAAMIEEVGLKGYTIGGAQVSDKHAGFIINRGGATFEDVCRLMEHVAAEVLRQFGTELEPEVKIIRGGMEFSVY